MLPCYPFPAAPDSSTALFLSTCDCHPPYQLPAAPKPHDPTYSLLQAASQCPIPFGVQSWQASPPETLLPRCPLYGAHLSSRKGFRLSAEKPASSSYSARFTGSERVCVRAR